MMKKLINRMSLFAILFLLIQEYASGKTGPGGYEIPRIELKGVNFTVDPRIELFHTIEVLQGIPLVNFIDLDYKSKIQSHFEQYKNHPVFKYLDRNPMYGAVFHTIDAPITFLLQLTNEFEWRKDIDFAVAITPQLDSLRMMMKDFSEKANYPGFFNSNTDLYNISLATLTYNLTKFDERNRLLNYCGNESGASMQFNVVINFLGWGNFGPRLYKPGGVELYAILAPEKSAIRVPTFDIGALYKLLWHEFAHSFANPAIEKYESQFEALNYLWEPVKESMKSQSYHSWQSVIKEHLTEAIACRMAASKFGEEAAELNYTRYQRGKNWMYLTPLISSLKVYEKSRDAYPDINSFMPRVIEALKQVKQRDIEAWKIEAEKIREPNTREMPTIGDIYNKDSILFIVSSSERDKKADIKLKKYIADTKERIKSLRSARIVVDTIALKMDLSKYNLSVWGTPEGNLFLKKHMDQVPILIREDEVIAENVYNGDGYGVLIGWVNPFNKQNMMAIYTGQNPSDVVDFNKIMNGGGNYHIFKNFVTLKQGVFKRSGAVWLAK